MVFEYEAEFEGVVHVWTQSDQDLFIRVERIENGQVLAEDDDSGGGTTPYAWVEVETGGALAILLSTTRGIESAAGQLCLRAEVPPDHPERIRARTGKADSLSMRGDGEGAHELWEAVLADMKGTLPPDHPDLSAVRINLATTLRKLGDLEGARELQAALLAHGERTLSPDDPYLSAIRNNLAVTLSTLGDLESARELQEGVAGRHATHLATGPSGPARRPGQPGRNALRAGRSGGARELHEAVLADMKRTPPPDHRDLLIAQSGLARVLSKLGDLERARELEEVVLAAWERLGPPETPDLLIACGNLASTLRSLGEIESACEFEERVLAARERLLPPDHPDLIQAKNNLALTLHQLGDLEGARALEEAVLAGQGEFLAGLRGESPRFARAAALAERTRIEWGLYISEGTRDSGPSLYPLQFSVIEDLRAISGASSEVALAIERSRN